MQELRQNTDLSKDGMVIEGGFFEKKLGAQLTLADRLGASHSIILGDEEIQKGLATLRTMKTSSQEKVPFGQLAQHLHTLARA
jgi:histidyl-tRNA synthetase